MDARSNSCAGLRCLFIGPLANHALVGRVAALVAAGCEVNLVNASSDDVDWIRNCYPVPQARIIDYWIDPFYRGKNRTKCYILEYLRSLAWVPEDRQLAGRLRAIISAINPTFAVVHYGSYAIHYARLLKRVEPRLPVIDILNLLPSHVDLASSLTKLFRGWWGKLEDSNYRNWLKRMDGIIYASSEMNDFATKKFGTRRNISCIMPDYLPVTFQGNVPINNSTELNIKDTNPRVIFLGAPERYGVTIDSIDKQFMELVNERIHIYSGTISQEAVSTGFGHCYPRFTNEEVFAGRLAEFASQFDAALMTYNISRRQERFRSTYPTRFLTALTAGIPIAIRAGLFDTCERFVAEHEIGFVYTSPSDLRTKLLDKALLTKYSLNARSKKRVMNAEAQGDELRNFIKRVIGNAIS